MRLGRWFLLAFGIAAAACASTIGPVIPSIQVLVVLDSLDDTLRIIPVDSPNVVHKLVVGSGVSQRHALALSGQYAAVGYSVAGASGSVFTVDMATGQAVCSGVALDRGGSIAALAVDDRGFFNAAVPATGDVAYLNPQTCGAGTQNVPHGPTGFANARGAFFIVVGNGGTCVATLANCSTSWLTSTAGLVPLSDSIPLSLPGNALGAVLASDGLLYVINAGSGFQANARLSQVSPTTKAELSVIAGFGTLPKYIATDGDRVFVASEANGLMVYNTRTGLLERDARSAIPLVGAPRGLTADDVGRVYALIAGGCGVTTREGQVSVFGPDLVSRTPVTVGRCPVAIGVTDIPSTLYNFPPLN